MSAPVALPDPQARLTQARQAFLWACALDVAVRKPGNVSAASPGHAMDARQFMDSAAAAAGPLFAPGQRVGARIEAAVAATRAAAGCNTNLGILLLCAPLAAALECPRPELALPAACRATLAGLDVDDARAAYRAIALANPGGLGQARDQDVAAAPTVDLRAAMALAAGRDSIARQYACGYADIFGTGLAVLRAERTSLAAAVQDLYLSFLSGWPDSHIVRKLGPAVAQSVTGEAAAWLARRRHGWNAADEREFAAWDEDLKARGINPGTSADLVVCTLFAAALLQPELAECRAGGRWHGLCIRWSGIGHLPASE